MAQDEASRGAFLRTACTSDDELRQELESLVALECTAEGFMDALALHMVARRMADDQRPSLLGQQIGHYRLLSRLGAGGMAEVYLAEDVRLHRQVALKLFAADRMLNATYAQRYVREARAASVLNHPNIVTVYDIGESEAGCFIAMEFVSGNSLRDLIARRLPVEAAARVVAQVARALADAHAAGIIHRDIKPENIMVRSDGHVKVVDFGLARAPHVSAENPGIAGATDETITGTGIVPGTVVYMSPEQSVGDSLTVATDVFSLGVVLYELLTGRLPINADSRLGHIVALALQPVAAPSHQTPEIPPVLDDLVLQMLHRQAARRPSAEAVAARLQAFTQPAESSAGEPTRSFAGPVGTSSQHRSPLIGREAERTALRSRLDDAVEGRGSILLMGGEPGIGKSRLAEAILEDARQRGCLALVGHCYEMEGAPP